MGVVNSPLRGRSETASLVFLICMPWVLRAVVYMVHTNQLRNLSNCLAGIIVYWYVLNLLVRFKVLSITEATPSIHFKLMLTGRLLLLARDRSGWYSNCTHDVLSIDWLVFIDVGNEH